MAEYLKLQNDSLTAHITPLGAQIVSLKRNADGEEYIWQNGDGSWPRSGPVLFPICGRLYESKYTLDGKTYEMPQHGFALTSSLEVLRHTDDTLVLARVSDDETKKCYPFDCTLKVTFKLVGASVHVVYEVENRSDRKMPFSVGAHEGYACEGGVEEYELVFDGDTSLERSMLDGGFVTGKTENVPLESGRMTLSYAEFDRGTYIFRRLSSHSVTLTHHGMPRLRVDFTGFPTLALWTLSRRAYLCIEPWYGMSERAGKIGDLYEKDGILTLEPGKTFRAEHRIDIL